MIAICPALPNDYVKLINVSSPCSILKIRTKVQKQREENSSERQDDTVKQDMIMTSIEVKPNAAYKTVSHQQDQETLDMHEAVYEIPIS